jgi:hypothetical protein
MLSKCIPFQVIPVIDMRHLMTTVLPQQIVTSTLPIVSHNQDVSVMIKTINFHPFKSRIYQSESDIRSLFMFLSMKMCFQVKCKNRALKKIAPKPSPLHVSAAIALSELAGNPDQT